MLATQRARPVACHEVTVTHDGPRALGANPRRDDVTVFADRSTAGTTLPSEPDAPSPPREAGMSRGSARTLWRGSAVALVASTAIQCTTPTSPQDGDTYFDVLAATALAARVDLVTVTVDPDSIDVGGRATALAVVQDASGRVLAESRVAWTSGNPAVATVDRSSGAITGMAPGQTAIIASVKGRRGQTTLTVLPRETPPPTPIPVTATLAIIAQPGGSTSGSLLSPQPAVHVIDDRGHRLTGYSGVVTASLASGQGTLSGTTSVA